MSAERRRALLDEAFAIGRSYREVEGLLHEATTDGTETNRLIAIRDQHHDSISMLLHEYKVGLPSPEITRCPFTQAAVQVPIDTFGLDGFWWNYNGSTRQRELDVPDTFFALTGAVRLTAPVRTAPILCKPGPEAPYVLPRILEHDDVRAVVSSIAIGEHQGHAIAYFAKPMPWDLRRVDAWGANHFWYVAADGEWGWDQDPLVEEDMDFDLAPWAERGKLLWIAPGDSQLELHTGVNGCPYLDLPGRQHILRIEDGAVWTRQEVE